MQAIAEQSRVIRLPLNKIGLLNKIKKAKSILDQKLEREASVEEIAELVEATEDEIRIALSSSNRTVSTDAPFSNNEDTTLTDVLFNPDNPQPDNNLMASSLSTEVKRALSTLTDREREVVTLFYGIGLNHGLTLEEIGERYDLTRERVRQIKEKAIRRLKNISRSKILRTYLG